MVADRLRQLQATRYVAVEVSFIQRFVVFLGHPAYATSVVLLGFLVSSGLGSFCSDRLFRVRAWGFVASILAVVGLLLFYNEALPLVFRSDLSGSSLFIEYKFVPNLNDFDLSVMTWDVKFAKPLSACVLVIAAVSVVLP